MTSPVRFLRPVALWMAFLVCLCAFPVRGTLADSFTIRCDWFDRGNVDAGSGTRNFAGKYPCMVNGGVMSNTAEYDLAKGNNASPPVFAGTSDPDYQSLLGILATIRSEARGPAARRTCATIGLHPRTRNAGMCIGPASCVKPKIVGKNRPRNRVLCLYNRPRHCRCPDIRGELSCTR